MTFLCLLVLATGSASASVTAQDFEARLRDYVALHKKLEAELPKLPDKASPEEIDRNQRALATRIAAARAGAREGDVFTPAVEDLLKRTVREVLTNPGGRNVRGSIEDENVPLPKLVVNGRYPDKVPLATMPAQVLAALPPLEEDLEYRFIGRRLVLLDVHAHLIVDFTGEILP
jgi:hypothetical protein